MLKSIASSVISSALGEYIEAINSKDMELMIWSGNVSLKNLKIKKDVLKSKGLPIDITEGIIDFIEINFPWKNLKSKPCVCRIKNLKITGQPLKDYSTLIEPDLGYSKSDLDKFFNEKNISKGEVLTGIVGTIVDNLIIEIENVQIKVNMEIDNKNVQVGVVLPKLRAFTVDKNLNEVFINSENTEIRKKAILSGLSVYFDIDKNVGCYLLKDFNFDAIYEHLTTDRILLNIPQVAMSITSFQALYLQKINDLQKILRARSYFSSCGRPLQQASDKNSLEWWKYFHRCSLKKVSPLKFSPKNALIFLKNRSSHTQEFVNYFDGKQKNINSLISKYGNDIVYSLMAYTKLKVNHENKEHKEYDADDLKSIAELGRSKQNEIDFNFNMNKFNVKLDNCVFHIDDVNAKFHKGTDNNLLNCTIGDIVLENEGKKYFWIEHKKAAKSIDFCMDTNQKTNTNNIKANISSLQIYFDFDFYSSFKNYYSPSEYDIGIEKEVRDNTILEMNYILSTHTNLNAEVTLDTPTITLPNSNPITFQFSKVYVKTDPIKNRKYGDIDSYFDRYDLFLQDFKVSIGNKLICQPFTTKAYYQKKIVIVGDIEDSRFSMDMDAIKVNLSSSQVQALIDYGNKYISKPTEEKSTKTVKKAESKSKPSTIVANLNFHNFTFVVMSEDDKENSFFEIDNLIFGINKDKMKASIDYLTILDDNKRPVCKFGSKSNSILFDNEEYNKLIVTQPIIDFDIRWISKLIDFLQIDKRLAENSNASVNTEVEKESKVDDNAVGAKFGVEVLKPQVCFTNNDGKSLIIAVNDLAFLSDDKQMQGSLKELIMSVDGINLNKPINFDFNKSKSKISIQAPPIDLSMSKENYELLMDFTEFYTTKLQFESSNEKTSNAPSERLDLDIQMDSIKFSLLEDQLVKTSLSLKTIDFDFKENGFAINLVSPSFEFDNRVLLSMDDIKLEKGETFNIDIPEINASIRKDIIQWIMNFFKTNKLSNKKKTTQKTEGKDTPLSINIKPISINFEDINTELSLNNLKYTPEEIVLDGFSLKHFSEIAKLSKASLILKENIIVDIGLVFLNYDKDAIEGILSYVDGLKSEPSADSIDNKGEIEKEQKPFEVKVDEFKTQIGPLVATLSKFEIKPGADGFYRIVSNVSAVSESMNIFDLQNFELYFQLGQKISIKANLPSMTLLYSKPAVDAILEAVSVLTPKDSNKSNKESDGDNNLSLDLKIADFNLIIEHFSYRYNALISNVSVNMFPLAVKFDTFGINKNDERLLEFNNCSVMLGDKLNEIGLDRIIFNYQPEPTLVLLKMLTSFSTNNEPKEDKSDKSDDEKSSKDLLLNIPKFEIRLDEKYSMVTQVFFSMSNNALTFKLTKCDFLVEERYIIRSLEITYQKIDENVNKVIIPKINIALDPTDIVNLSSIFQSFAIFSSLSNGSGTENKTEKSNTDLEVQLEAINLSLERNAKENVHLFKLFLDKTTFNLSSKTIDLPKIGLYHFNLQTADWDYIIEPFNSKLTLDSSNGFMCGVQFENNLYINISYRFLCDLMEFTNNMKQPLAYNMKLEIINQTQENFTIDSNSLPAGKSINYENAGFRNIIVINSIPVRLLDLKNPLFLTTSTVCHREWDSDSIKIIITPIITITNKVDKDIYIKTDKYKSSLLAPQETKGYYSDENLQISLDGKSFSEVIKKNQESQLIAIPFQKNTYYYLLESEFDFRTSITSYTIDFYGSIKNSLYHPLLITFELAKRQAVLNPSNIKHVTTSIFLEKRIVAYVSFRDEKESKKIIIKTKNYYQKSFTLFREKEISIVYRVTKGKRLELEFFPPAVVLTKLPFNLFIDGKKAEGLGLYGKSDKEIKLKLQSSLNAEPVEFDVTSCLPSTKVLLPTEEKDIARPILINIDSTLKNDKVINVKITPLLQIENLLEYPLYLQPYNEGPISMSTIRIEANSNDVLHYSNGELLYMLIIEGCNEQLLISFKDNIHKTLRINNKYIEFEVTTTKIRFREALFPQPIMICNMTDSIIHAEDELVYPYSTAILAQKDLEEKIKINDNYVDLSSGKLEIDKFVCRIKRSNQNYIILELSNGKMQAEKENSYSITIPSLNISYVDQYYNEKLLFTVDNFDFNYKEQDSKKFSLQLGKIQLDDQHPLAKSEVVLGTEIQDDSKFLSTTFEIQSDGYYNFSLDIKPLNTFLDLSFVSDLLSMIKLPQQKEEKKEEEFNSYSVAFRSIKISPISFRFYLSSDTGRTNSYKPPDLPLNLIPAINQAQLDFKDLELENFIADPTSIMKIIDDNYISLIKARIVRILFNTNIFFNIGGVTSGFAKEAEKLFSGDISAVGGVTIAPILGLGEGAFGTASSLLHFVSSTTPQGQNYAGKSAGDHFKGGIKAFGNSLVSGIQGIYQRPLEGAKKDGALGAITGAGKGVLGFVLSPLTSVADAGQAFLGGAKKVFSSETTFQRRRYSKALIDKVMSGYDEKVSQYQNYIQTELNDNWNDRLEFIYEIDDKVLGVSQNYIVCFKSGKKQFEKRLYEIWVDVLDDKLSIKQKNGFHYEIQMYDKLLARKIQFFVMSKNKMIAGQIVNGKPSPVKKITEESKPQVKAQ